MAKLGDLFHIGRLERRLIAGPLPNPLAFQPGPGYAPALVFGTNLLMFSLILVNLRVVARRTTGGGSPGLPAS